MTTFRECGAPDPIRLRFRPGAVFQAAQRAEAGPAGQLRNDELGFRTSRSWDAPWTARRRVNGLGSPSLRLGPRTNYRLSLKACNCLLSRLGLMIRPTSVKEVQITLSY